MTNQFFYVLTGITLILLGRFLYKTPDRMYRLFQKGLGSGAFPEEGSRRDTYETFFSQFGFICSVIGVFPFILAIYEWFL